jgi:hypothetical protein
MIHQWENLLMFPVGIMIEIMMDKKLKKYYASYKTTYLKKIL